MPEITVQYGAIVVAALAHYVLGALWYSPVLFANRWMALSGLKKEDMNKDAAKKAMIIPLFTSLVAAYVLAHVVGYAQADTVMEGLQAGFWIWLGFVATIMVVQTVFGKRSWKLFCLDTTYQLIGYLIMGVILAVWK